MSSELDKHPLNIKKIIADKVAFNVSAIAGPESILEPDEVVFLEDIAGRLVVQLRRYFLKALVKTESKSVPEWSCVYADYPDRPIDYLWHFLGSYFPYFMRLKRVKREMIDDKLVRSETKNEHYHLIPAELYAKGSHVEFLYWDGGDSYYGGVPGEWEALKDLERACTMEFNTDGSYFRDRAIHEALYRLKVVRNG